MKHTMIVLGELSMVARPGGSRRGGVSRPGEADAVFVERGWTAFTRVSAPVLWGLNMEAKVFILVAGRELLRRSSWHREGRCSKDGGGSAAWAQGRRSLYVTRRG